MEVEHSTLATIPKLIARVLELEGKSVTEVFSRSGLDYEQVIENTDRIPMENMYSLWEQAVKETGNESFGLLAASLFQPAYLKGIGLAWIASETLGQGLERFINNISMVNTAVKIELVTEGQDVCLRYLPADIVSQEPIRAHPCAVQLGLGFLLRMFRLAASRPVPVSKVYFKHAISVEAKEQYEGFFQCSVYGQHTFNGISFERAILDEPLPAADKELAELNDQAIAKYLKKVEQPEIVKRVYDSAIPLLPSGCPTENEIAIRLNMSKRTLQRKLSSIGATYGGLLTTLRNEMAKNYLSSSNISVTEIAYQVGYGSPSTFARAFKQTNGFSPIEFRAQLNIK